MRSDAAPSPGGSDPRPRLSPSPHPFERERLASVREFEPFTRLGDPVMASIAREATETCGTRTGLVSLMEEGEERVLASVGIPARNIPRHRSLCAHVILESHVFVVEDAREDPRFRDLPGVAGEPFLRFYAGAPILDATGLPLGAVCVFDSKRHEISSKRLIALARLAEVASAALEARLLLADTRARHAPAREAKSNAARFEALLTTLVEPRPSCR